MSDTEYTPTSSTRTEKAVFEFTQVWAEGMIAEALVARGVPEDEARKLADMTDFIDDIRAEAFNDGGGGDR